MAIVLNTISDSKQAQRDLAKLRESVDGIKKSAEESTSKLASFGKSILIGGGLTFAVKKYITLNDLYTNMSSRIRLVTKNQEELNNSFLEAGRIAITARANLEGVVQLYTKVQRAGEQYNISQKQSLRFTESITKAIQISGASTTEAAAALLQFGQGLASNRLSGEELRSVLENAPELAQLIADGLGIARGELKKFGEDGKLTFKAVFEAIYKQNQLIDEKFKKIGVTYQGAFLNMRTSLFMLGVQTKNTLTSMKGGFADMINFAAKKIFNFAERIDMFLNIARMEMILLKVEVMELFEAISFDNLIDSFNKFMERISTGFKPFTEKVVTFFVAAFAIVAMEAKNLYNTILTYLGSSEFGRRILAGFYDIIYFVRDTVEWLKLKFKELYDAIDIRKIFPGLDSALAIVKSWVKQVEAWFKWLYDKVIGNSWIPDLVNGTIKWLSRLLGPALDLIKYFTNSSNSLFSRLTVGASIFIGLTKFKDLLFSIYGVIGMIGALMATAFLIKTGTGGGVSKSEESNQSKQPTTILIKIKTATERTFDNIKQLVTNFEKSDSVLVRTIKQVFGMPDRVPGQLWGEEIDTTANVGRGKSRKKDDRPLGHDVINALPRDIRAPLVTTVLGTLGLVIGSTFDGPFRPIIMSVFAAAAIGFSTRLVESKLIIEHFHKLAWSFTRTVSDGLTKAFKGNVLNNPFGLVTAIAAITLMFEKGREMIFGTLGKLATAPTKSVFAAEKYFSKRAVDSKIAQNKPLMDSLTKNAPKYFADQVTKFDKSFHSGVNKLVGVTSAITKMPMTKPEVINALTTGKTRHFGLDPFSPERITAKETIKNLRGLQENQTYSQNPRAAKKDLETAYKKLTDRSDKIGEELKASGDAVKDGIKNFSAGLGGVVGGVVGFQLGTEIAKGMKNYPEWAQIGVQMATSFVGQGIGSALGLAISSTLLMVASGIGTAIGAGFSLIMATAAGPFILAAVAIGAALYLGYKLFEGLPEHWKVAIKQHFSDVGEGFAEKFYGEPWRKFLGVLEGLGIVISTKAKEVERSGEAWNTKYSVGHPIEKAMGGPIFGPGTGTSDSIPALLSNGEFVVNSKDAKKNWQTLVAINSGQKPVALAEGTEVSNDRRIATTVDKVMNFGDGEAFRSFLSNMFGLPKVPMNRLLGSALGFSWAQDGFSLSPKEILLNLFKLKGIYNDPSKVGLNEADGIKFKETVDSTLKSIIDQSLLTFSEQMAANNITAGFMSMAGTVAGGPIGAATASMATVLALMFDQIAMPIPLGISRGIRKFRGYGALGSNPVIDSMMASIEELPIGTSEGWTAPIKASIKDLITLSKKQVLDPKDAYTAKEVIAKTDGRFRGVFNKILKEIYPDIDKTPTGFADGTAKEPIGSMVSRDSIAYSAQQVKRLREYENELPELTRQRELLKAHLNAIDAKIAPKLNTYDTESFIKGPTDPHIFGDPKLMSAPNYSPEEIKEIKETLKLRKVLEPTEFIKALKKLSKGVELDKVSSMLHGPSLDNATTLKDLHATYAINMHERGHAADLINRGYSEFSNPLLNKVIERELFATKWALDNALIDEPISREVLATALRTYLDQYDKTKFVDHTSKDVVKQARDFADDGLFNNTYGENKISFTNALPTLVDFPLLSRKTMNDTDVNLEDYNFIHQYERSKPRFDKFIEQLPTVNIVEDIISNLVNSFRGYATGGFIRGPGTETSDSIPAMLSKNEFVVNARDAKKNRSLLTAINSGAAVQGFSDGSETDPMAGELARLKNTEAVLGYKSVMDKFIDSLKDMINQIYQMFTGKSPLDTKGGFNGPKKERDSLTQVLEKQGEKGYKTIGDALRNSGWAEGFEADLSPKALKALQPQAFSDLLRLLDTRSRAENKLKDLALKDPKLEGPLAQDIKAGIHNLNQSIRRRARGEGAEALNIRDKGEGAGSLAFKDFFAGFNQVFKDIGLNIREFETLPAGVIGAMSTAVAPILELIKQRDATGSGPENAERLEDLNSRISEAIANSQDWIRTVIDSIRNPFEKNRRLFEETGTPMSKELFSSATGEERKAIVENAKWRGQLKQAIDIPDLDDETLLKLNAELVRTDKSLQMMTETITERNMTVMDRASRLLSSLSLDPRIAGNLSNRAMKDLETIRKENIAEQTNLDSEDDKTRLEANRRVIANLARSNKIATQDFLKNLDGFEKIQEGLKTAGMSLDKEVFNILPDELQEQLVGMSEKIAELALVVKYENDRNIARAAQNTLNDLRDNFSKRIAAISEKPGKLAGEEFAKGITTSFGDALKDLLKGKRDEDKSAWKTFIDKFLDDLTSSIINTFVDGMTKNAAEGITNILKSLGKGIWEAGAGVGGIFGGSNKGWGGHGEIPADSMAADAVSRATDLVKNGKLETAVSDFFSKFKGMFDGIDFGSFGKMISEGISKAIKFVQMLFMAEGGIVKGPGSGTSDSVPAMLSNGEFVVNAASTRKFAPLLSTINSGRSLRMAAGGLVTAASMATPAMATMVPSDISNSKSTVVNLSITGDISRQTKKEIYGMLPSIANGVNSYNKEKGNR